MLEAARRRKSDIPVDLNHEGGAAKGWVNPATVEIGVDEHGRLGLFGLSRWTPPAAEAIRNEEWRYFSPVVVFGGLDRETGEEILAEIHEGALTNNPFIDGMSAIALSRLRALNTDSSAQGGAMNMEENPTEAPEEAPESEESGSGSLKQIFDLFQVEDRDELLAKIIEIFDSNPEAMMALAGGGMSAEPEPAQMAATRELADTVKRLSRELKSAKADVQKLQDERDASRVCADFGLDPQTDADTIRKRVTLSRVAPESYAEMVEALGKPAGPPTGRVVSLNRGNKPEEGPLVKNLNADGRRLYDQLKGTSIDRDALLKAIHRRTS